MGDHAQVEELAAVFVREYLNSKGLTSTLRSFDSERTVETSINTRTALVKALKLEKLASKNKHKGMSSFCFRIHKPWPVFLVLISATPLSSILEVVVESLLHRAQKDGAFKDAPGIHNVSPPHQCL